MVPLVDDDFSIDAFFNCMVFADGFEECNYGCIIENMTQARQNSYTFL